MPSYINQLVFPENFLTSLRTIAMKEDEPWKMVLGQTVTNLLKRAHITESAKLHTCKENNLSEETNGLQRPEPMSRNKWASIVYRRGQKQLTRLFLKEAEQALQIALKEGNQLPVQVDVFSLFSLHEISTV